MHSTSSTHDSMSSNNPKYSWSSSFKSLQCCSLLAGVWVPLKPMKKQYYARTAIFMYETFLNLVLIGQLITFPIAILRVKVISMEATIRYGMSVGGFTSTCFISIYLQVRKRRLVIIMKRMKNLLKTVPFEPFQPEILDTISKRCFIFLAFPLLSNLIVAIASTVALPSLAYNCSNQEELKQPLNISNIFDEGFQFCEHDSYMMIFLKILGIILSMKRVTCDALFLSLFSLITEQLSLLHQTLDAALDNPESLINLSSWLNAQHEWARALEMLNSFTSPYMVIMMACNSLTMCFSAFAATKSSGKMILMSLTASYCFIILLQTFLYCYVGQKLRNEANNVSCAARRSNWLRAHPALVPGLALVAADCKDSFVVRGGPFFTLSLEFFASVVGAVVTYLVVLLQVK